MARNTGALQLTGTIGNIVIDSNGIARTKPPRRPITAQRTLENNREFGQTAKDAKVIRTAIRATGVSERTQHNRLVQVLRRALNANSTAARGNRTIERAGAIDVLPGFELSGNSRFDSVLRGTATFDETGLTVVAYDGSTYTSANASSPIGATHMRLATVVASIAATTNGLVLSGSLQIGSSNYMDLETATPLSMTTNPTVSETDSADIFFNIAIVALLFYQEVNSVYYELENGVYNVGAILFAG